MYNFTRSTAVSPFRQNCRNLFLRNSIFGFILLLIIFTFFNLPTNAQGTITGSFVGRVTNSRTGEGIPDAKVTFTNLDTGFNAATRSDKDGQFQRSGFLPGNYEIQVEAAGYKTQKSQSQGLFATQSNSVVPVPFRLEQLDAEPKSTAGVEPTMTPAPVNTPDVVKNAPINDGKGTEGNIDLNTQRVGTFSESEVRTLPLGGSTLTRTFDELALLIPGVAAPPQAIGNSVGPGVGGGVGTSGQFAVNGLRSRANNFTVDGSDNNDEDIGVRRQGFFSLVPQPIESVQQFSIITLLAPAEFGRNLGAQVNAISKSGTNNRFNGTIYALFNSNKLNARNYFDNADGDTSTTLRSSIFGNNNPVLVNGQQIQVTNSAGEKDSLTLLQGGFAVGGRIIRNKMFFFVSGEGQLLNGTQERHFAVPTVEQRSAFNAPQGLQACNGIFSNGVCRNNGVPINFSPAFPTSFSGDAVFSLFPFANDPTGVYGRNTYTQALSTDARGRILSGRYDWNIFHVNSNQQAFTARYNNTDDRRDLTDVGGAIFSAIQPEVRTDNFSSFLSGSITDNLSNEFRFSWGRTRLKFEELRDTTGFLLPISSSIIKNEADRRFLLNARLLLNTTIPSNCNAIQCIGAAQTNYLSVPISFGTTQDSPLGPVGQINIAGFSPVGVDVFNFPQERTNDTFQFADTLRWQLGRHTFSMGTDIRRVFLNSNLPRNSRPLATFNGGLCDPGRVPNCNTGGTRDLSFVTPQSFAALGAATGFFQSLVLPGNDSRIQLSYNQLDFFAQDEWRISPKLNITYGLRYEYNTTPIEADNKIEKTFQLSREQFPVPNPEDLFGVDLFKGFSDFIDGRTKIYEADRNNFAPRIGFAWSPVSNTVIRGGYGLYYDQIIGSVVSQTRNFPSVINVNTGGGDLNCNFAFSNNQSFFALLNPITGGFNPTDCSQDSTIVAPGTLNTLNSSSSVIDFLRGLSFFPLANGSPSFGVILPKRKLDTPMSHQYSIGVEQRLFGNTFLSATYVGTTGRNLLRFTTPNLGSNYIALVTGLNVNIMDNVGEPQLTGITIDPFVVGDSTRPNQNVGAVSQFETTGRSRYDSLQIGLRGRLTQDFQYRASYVFGEVKDDVSDVFDLAGAFALPQNSLTFEGEYAPANFDVRHRFTYSFIYDLPGLRSQNDFVRYLFGGWQIAGTGKASSGQPFTVNTVFDINFDGNLTDRLNNTAGIFQSNNRQRRLILNSTPQSLLAPFGTDGAIPRNNFRAASIIDVDLSFAKKFRVGENQNLQFRVDIFNFVNRANFGIPVRFLEAPSFGQAVDTVNPGRRIQIDLKYDF